jgi:hypothetical protein
MNCCPCPCTCWYPVYPIVTQPLIPCCPPCCSTPCTIVPCLPADATYPVAQQIFACNGLVAKEVTECSETVSKGVVIRTDPLGGTIASMGDVVTVFVSTGPC